MSHFINVFADYNVDVFTSLKKFEKECKKFNQEINPLVEGYSAWFENDRTGENCFIMYISKKSRDIDTTIIHECSHTISHIMACTGIDDDEFRSYTLAKLVKDVKKAIKKN